MFLERFYHEGLAQASYLIGCERTGEALVLDANRDLDLYLRTAAAKSLRITHVSETHIHADYVSGSRDLAHRVHARLLLSGEGGSDWQYAYAQEGSALLHDGDVFSVGLIRVRTVHTPGHTPEHLTFVVTDTATATHPMGAFTGDFIFVGDVGRPDLLERAAGIAGTMRDNAKQLYDSLQRFAATEPDYLQIWPGHGAGSACGKALGAVPSSTLGYEKLSNWAFQARDADSFIKEVLESQSEPPPYFAVMKRVNREGPAPQNLHAPLPRQAPTSLATVLETGAIVIDLRPTSAFASGAAPGTINLPLNESFVSRAGWLVPYDRDVYLLTGDDAAMMASAARRELSMIGIDRVRGLFGPDAIEHVSPAARVTVPQVDAREAAAKLKAGAVTVIDVRTADEWRQGHIVGAEHVPLGKLSDAARRLAENGRQVLLHCATGGRSGIGASILLAHGVPNVANMRGGYEAWRTAGLPTTTDGV